MLRNDFRLVDCHHSSWMLLKWPAKLSTAARISPMERSSSTDSSLSSHTQSPTCQYSVWKLSSQLKSFQSMTLWTLMFFKATWNSRWLHCCSMPWKKELAQNNLREWRLWEMLPRTPARWLTSLPCITTDHVKLSSPESWSKLFRELLLWRLKISSTRNVPNAIIVERFQVRRKFIENGWENPKAQNIFPYPTSECTTKINYSSQIFVS